MGSVEAIDLFDRMMSANAEGFDGGHIEAAYHALMSGLHLAQDLGDESLLLRVAKVAEEQGRHVDSLSPPHRLSSKMATARGHESVFQLTARQATAQASLAHARTRQNLLFGPRRPEAPKPG